MDITKEWLIQKYVVEKLSSVAIAKLIGRKTSFVESKCHQYDIQLRTQSESAKIRKRPFKCRELRNKELLIQKYCDEGLTSYEIAVLFHTNQRSVLDALKKYSINIRKACPRKPLPTKYTQLEDKNWLQQKYEVEKKTTKDIAYSIGCSPDTIIRFLRKHGIKVRDNKESHLGLVIGSKYDILNNSKWLKKQYNECLSSTNDICVLAGAKTPNTARQALIRNNIQVRNVSDGLTCNREDYGFVLNKDVIEGSLLGDAGLGIWNCRSNQSYPYFYKKNKFKDHVLFVAQQIFSKGVEKRVKEEVIFKFGKYLRYYSLRSFSYKSLLPLYRIWYPASNNYKKVIPEDLDITAQMLLHWFLDDGCSHLRKRKTKQVCITMCSESFSRNDQEILSQKIWDKFQIRCSVRKTQCGTGWRTFIRQRYAPAFFEIIGPPPVASLAYKWK